MITKKMMKILAIFFLLAIALSAHAMLVFAVSTVSGDTPSAQQTDSSAGSAQTSSSTGGMVPRCEGGDINNLQGTRMRRCLRFKDKFEQYAQQNGVSNLGLDTLFLFVTANGENGCRSYAVDKDTDPRAEVGGILQVDNPCHYHPEQCPTVDIELDYGTKEVTEKMNAISGMSDLSGRELMWMVWFAYNRGTPTARNAVQKMGEGMTIQQATAEACETFSEFRVDQKGYDCSLPTRAVTRRDYDCPDVGKNPICANGKSCSFNFYCRIKQPDVGVHYADHMWHSYVSNCEDIGGHIVDGGGPLTGSQQDLSSVVPAIEDRSYRPTHPYFNVPLSISPSFSMSLDYDFSIYETVPLVLRDIERCEGDLECVLEGVVSKEQEMGDADWIVQFAGNILTEDENGEKENAGWEAYCETPDQHAVNSLAEAIDACAKSGSRNCYCSYTLPKSQAEEVGLLESAARAFVDLLGFGSLLNPSDDWEERIFSFTNSGNNLRVTIKPPATADSQILSNVNFKRIHPSLRGASPNLFRYQRTDTGNVIDIHKDGNNNISLFQRSDSPSEDQCELNNPLLKMCIIKDDRVMAYNSQQQEIGMQNLVLKFAYMFPTEVTDVPDFRVDDVVLSSGSVFLSWSPLTGTDVTNYNIYFSEDASKEANIRGQDPSDIDTALLEGISVIDDGLFVEDAQPITLSLNSLSSPQCVVTETSCEKTYVLTTALAVEDDPGIDIVSETLYKSTVDNKFFYLLSDLEDNHRYLFAITAVDNNDQESPSFNTPVTQQDSVDDAPAGVANIVSITPGAESFSFEIDPVDYNIDGSPTEPVSQYRLYCFDNDAPLEIDLSQVRSMATIGLNPSDEPLIFSRPAGDFDVPGCALRFLVVGVKDGVDVRGVVSSSVLAGMSS
ncbi:hypothetical protein HQ545_08480 [Candidatus Woesearchaeota archaeon]|nr:hypothetical protein [Candidatus Woesearchaeota archaeon]